MIQTRQLWAKCDDNAIYPVREIWRGLVGRNKDGEAVYYDQGITIELEDGQRAHVLDGHYEFTNAPH